MTGNVYVHHQTGRADYHVTRAQYGFIDDELYIEIDAEPIGTSEITDCVGREFHLSQVFFNERKKRNNADFCSGRNAGYPVSSCLDIPLFGEQLDHSRVRNLFV